MTPLPFSLAIGGGGCCGPVSYMSKKRGGQRDDL